VAAAQLAGPAIASPWAPNPSHLENIVWADIFGADVPAPLTRAEAMRVAAVARTRHIICTTIARIPLRGYRGDEPLEGSDAPSWIDQTSGLMSDFHRMLWTVDDLLFYGWSCWRRTRNSAPQPFQRSFPLAMDRIPWGQWRLDDVGRVELLDGQEWRVARADEVVLIPGPHEGLLTIGQDVIRHARDLQNSAATAARNPAAYLALKQTGGDDLTDDKIDRLIGRWAAARRGENGGVAWLNTSVDVKELGTFSEHLLVEGRNAAAVDVAREASIPAELIDAITNQGSLTYQTSRDNDRRAVDYGLGGYMSATSGRLSLDDVSPRGQRAAFDLEEWLTGTVPGQPAATPTPPPAPTTSSHMPPAPVAAPNATTGETPQ
jgi:hypothetical protein